MRDALFASDDALFLLHVGSGFRIKGLKSTIESLPHLLKKGIKAMLLVAGNDRRGTKNLQRLSSALGVEKNVLFLGGVKDIERYYAASDIFVVPSLFETFGVAAIEALSLGLPVIVGRGAGVSYMIEEEKAGKVIDVPADPGKLADMIAETMREEKRLESSGGMEREKAHRRAVASSCSREAVSEKFLGIIVRHVEGRKPLYG
ncbi:MAG: glycosyltransferase family 4 protein [Deltaproteobacteria bacterium]|nr:glycosyltransferase family 4 protein [Deltaproteobacteria bacterium]